MKSFMQKNKLTFWLVTAYFLLLVAIRLYFGWNLVWDETWYANIVLNGYSYQEGAQSTVAFFPLYPVLLMVISLNGLLPLTIASLVINYLAVIGICSLGIAIARYYRKSISVAEEAEIIAAILSFPTAFFFTALYAEAVLVLLVTAAIYFALKERYLWAFVLAGLASGAKSIGIAAVITCLVIVIVREKKFSAKLVRYAVIGVSGLLVYMTYLWVVFRSPLLFYSAQSLWGRNNGFFVQSLWRQFVGTPKRLLGSEVSKSFIFARLYSIAVAFGTLVISFLLIKKRLWWALALVAVVIGIPLASGSFDSLSRYTLVVIPVLTALLFAHYRRVTAWLITYVMIVVFAVIQVALYVYFLRGDVFIA